MNTFLTAKRSRLATKSLILAALAVAIMAAATPSVAGSKRTTIIHETVYYAPAYRSHDYRSASVIIPVSQSLFLGLGGFTIDHGHRHREVHRTVSRYDRHYDRRYDNYYDRGFRHQGHGNAFGHRYSDHKRHEPARGRWSGSDRHRDVTYIDRDGRRSSSYREAERRSVVIRERSR